MSKKTFEIRWWTAVVIAISMAVLLGSTGVAAYSAHKSADTVKEMAASQPPEWLMSMQYAQYIDLWSVFDCTDEIQDFWDDPVPCPDYIATVESRGEGKDDLPVLTPARNAKGEIVIDLKAEWHPDGCPTGRNSCRQQGWDVTPVFATSVVPFASNEKYMGRWTGPQFFQLQVGTFPMGSSSNMEFYAGDATQSIHGMPLPKDRLDS